MFIDMRSSNVSSCQNANEICHMLEQATPIGAW